MGNMSLVYVYPSFNQMVSTTTPMITMLVEILAGTRYNKWAYISVPILSGGFLLCYRHEKNFHILGVIYSLLAAVFRAGKTVLQAQLLQEEKHKMNSVTLLYYMAPYAGVLLFSISLALEGTRPYESFYDFASGEWATGAWQTAVLLSITGLNACFLNIFNFLTTFYTGPVVLQVLGNVKTVLGVGFSGWVFGNPVTLEQWIGWPDIRRHRLYTTRSIVFFFTLPFITGENSL